MENLIESLIVECAAKLPKSKDKSIEEYADELLENAKKDFDRNAGDNCLLETCKQF